MKGAAEDRFWAKVARGDPAECWEWAAGKTTGGYGVVRLKRRTPTYAHRHALQLATGSLGLGLMACHRCDNPACCNPTHLFWGTQKDNIGDAHAKGRTFIMPRQTRCKNGHEVTAENTRLDKDRGGWKRTCRICARDRQQRNRRKKATA